MQILNYRLCPHGGGHRKAENAEHADLSGPHQRRKKRTQPPPKENLLENFSGLKEKIPGRWWIQKPIKTRKAISTTEIFPLWTPFFFCKEKFCTGAGRCMVSFSQTIHFSLFTCCLCRFWGRSFTGFFRNKNAEFTESLSCSLFII